MRFRRAHAKRARMRFCFCGRAHVFRGWIERFDVCVCCVPGFGSLEREAWRAAHASSRSNGRSKYSRSSETPSHVSNSNLLLLSRWRDLLLLSHWSPLFPDSLCCISHVTGAAAPSNSCGRWCCPGVASLKWQYFLTDISPCVFLVHIAELTVTMRTMSLTARGNESVKKEMAMAVKVQVLTTIVTRRAGITTTITTALSLIRGLEKFETLQSSGVRELTSTTHTATTYDNNSPYLGPRSREICGCSCEWCGSGITWRRRRGSG